MSAQLQTAMITSQLRREIIFDGAPERESAQSLVVRISAVFKAAPSRLYYALTIPEYIETWLTPPDSDEVRCMGNPTAGEPLSIEMRHDRQVTANIFADYKSISGQDLNIRWYVQSRTRAYSSQLRVSIRIIRADALLRIRHSGFAHADDWRWHQELWGLSLAKMQMLIR
jgi:hypothetical protein